MGQARGGASGRRKRGEQGALNVGIHLERNREAWIRVLQPEPRRRPDLRGVSVFARVEAPTVDRNPSRRGAPCPARSYVFAHGACRPHFRIRAVGGPERRNGQKNGRRRDRSRHRRFRGVRGSGPFDRIWYFGDAAEYSFSHPDARHTFFFPSEFFEPPSGTDSVIRE